MYMLLYKIVYIVLYRNIDMTKKKPEGSPPNLADGDRYRAQMKESTFGHLDDYFSMMMSLDPIEKEERDVYELAVRAFINDLAHNGLPTIRRERYNREFQVSCHVFGLGKKYEEMMNAKREYSP